MQWCFTKYQTFILVLIVIIFHILFSQEDADDFAEEQGLMGRFVNLLQAETADQQAKVSIGLRSYT